MKDKPLICVLGPTASGKTALAVALAKKCNGAIISADSRQVYRDMDIGTGKDLDEYGTIPYYMIDIKEAGDNYSVAHFQDDFQEAYRQILALGHWPILCGGTGMYIQAVLQDYNFLHVPLNEQLRQRLEDHHMDELTKLLFSLPQPTGFRADISTRKRLIRAIEIAEWNRKGGSQAKEKKIVDHMIFGISLPVDVRRARITTRLDKRLGQGLIEEVIGLLHKGVPAEKLLFYGMEYKYAVAYVMGEMEYDRFFAKLNTEIHRFAKRQVTYFRKMEKDGLHIHWLNGLKPVQDNVKEIIAAIKNARED